MGEEFYGNTHYPHSRRMWSRPFSGFHSREGTGDRGVRENLFEMGDLFIGAPFSRCCDIDFVDPQRGRYFSPFKSQEEKIVDSPQYAVLAFSYNDVMTEQAFFSLRSRISDSMMMEEVPGKYNHIRRVVPYDMAGLADDFRTIWDKDFMLDPRLTHAEGMFFLYADGKSQDWHEYRDDAERLQATLQWMRAPENAQRVSFAFLYSRLAQHFGETSPESLKIARFVAREIDSGEGARVAAQLREDPDSCLDSIEEAEETSPLAYMFRQRATRSGVVNPEALGDCAERLVADYGRLKNGSWAEKQLLALAKPVAVPVQGGRGLTIS